MFADVFVILLTCHWAADYPGQSDHQARHKADRTVRGWIANLTHALTHVVITAAVLLIVGQVLPEVAPAPAAVARGLVWVGFSHSLIDRRWMVRWWMEHTGQRGFLRAGGAAHVDQAAHVLLGLLPATVLIRL
ncbi:DUF3307 domain-containing protein [Kitasatospora sp. NPDC059327]|uniref:DUF3307 domain-containing protein n=1 Tax=Kitasatospora sp. NPDC059327 TaxID=3346803 RepID=UPI0036D08679